MSNLTFTRQWLLNVSNMSDWLIAGSNSISQNALMKIKNVLKGSDNGKYGWTDQSGTIVSTPTFWTVDHSCDSIIAGTVGDGIDRWSDLTKIVWGNVAGINSWIVLRNTTAGLFWLISCENSASDTNTLDMWVSKVGFGATYGGTNGTTSARPTATDEQNMLVSTLWGSGNGLPIRFHIMMSSDGLATRVLITRAMSLCGMWLIEPLADPIENLENNLVAVAKGANGSFDFSSGLSQTAIPLARKIGGPVINGIFTAEGSRYQFNTHITSTLADRTIWNDMAQRNSVFAINIYGLGYPTRGKIGTIADMWGGSDLILSGRSWPGDHSRKLIALGPLVIPWNGTVPELH